MGAAVLKKLCLNIECGDFEQHFIESFMVFPDALS